jgi:hypothetical protein
LPSLNVFIQSIIWFSVFCRSAEELYNEFNPSEMVFQPPVPVPKKVEPKAKPPFNFHLRNEALSSYVKEVSERHAEETVDFSLFKFSTDS